MSSIKNVAVTEDSARWETVINGTITVDALRDARRAVIKDLSKEIAIKGFRPGHAPEAEIVKVAGDTEIARRSAEYVVREELPRVLAEHKINIVDTPQVTLETPASDGSLPFSARAPLAPRLTLPDYAKISAEQNTKRTPTTITDKEYEDALLHLRRERKRMELLEGGSDATAAHASAHALTDETLPPFDDAFAKELGYATAEEFSLQFRAHLTTEKERRDQDKHRASIIEAIMKDTEAHFPALLTEYEQDDFMTQFEHDVARTGHTVDAYLTEVKKTREEIRKSFEKPAHERAKMRLMLGEIARREHIEPSEDDITHELEHAAKHYPNVTPDNLRAFVTHAMKNEATMRWLESRT